ncbi:MAG: hypothetical protein IPP19_01865 [Verrucomicrobia bacterium]|nr:hypothetical protein [Verrucomicrobiota bacterium]
MRDPKNYLRLQCLPADEAIACYLAGDFTMGEEFALAEAIQKGLSLPMTKADVEAILLDCLDDEMTAEECRSTLIAGRLK